MEKKVVVVGELHQDLYYESEFYEDLVNEIVNQMLNFVRYNPDDLMNKKLLDKVVKRGFSETPKKIIGNCYFKRGGNGNNSSEYLAALGNKTKLVSVVGRGSKWMYPELEALGIDTSAIFKIDEITPVSTIIKSPFTTKIHLAPNLKNRMNFDSVKLPDNLFDDAKLIFSTPIATKFKNLFEKGHQSGLITAFNIETQKIRSIEKLDSLITNRYDFFFLNLKDAFIILNEKKPVEEVDQIFKKYAKIRIYTAGKDGSHVMTDHQELFFPGIEVSAVVDRTGAGDCYAAGFLSEINELIADKEHLQGLLSKEKANELEKILSQCIEYASYTAIYKITKQQAPSKDVMEQFIKEFDIKKENNA